MLMIEVGGATRYPLPATRYPLPATDEVSRR
jgi:hypothetical protein